MMTKKNLIASITFFMLLILTSIPALAAEDFFASSPQAEINACQCQEIINTITVRNTNQPDEGLVITISNGEQENTATGAAKASAYTLTQEGKAASWSSLLPGFFSLEAGESQTIENFINIPCDARGAYPLTTAITTQAGMVKEMEQTLVVKECGNTQVASSNTKAETCPCQPVQFEFTVTNTGSYAETYLIGADGKHTAYLTLSENTITLKPGESRLIYAFLNAPCSFHGEIKLDILVQSQRNRQLERLPVQAAVAPCYDFEVATGRLIHLYDENAAFEPFLGTYEVCEKESHLLIPVRVTNIADIPNDYLLTLDGPEWASLSNNAALGLRKDEYSEVFIVLEPWANLDTKEQISLEVRTAIGDITKSFDIPVSVTWCSTPGLFQDIKKISVNYSVISTQLPVKNLGAREETYDLSVNLDWGEIEPSRITLGPGEAADIGLVTFPDETALPGKYDAIVTAIATSNGVAYEKELSVRLSEGTLWGRLNAMTAGYLMYLLIGLILLIIIIFLLWLGSKKGEHEAKVTQEEGPIKDISDGKKISAAETVTRDKKPSSFWKWCCLIILFILIAIGLWYAYASFGDAVTSWWNESAEVVPVEEEPVEDGTEGALSRIVSPIIGFFTIYLWYILIGILIAIIIIVILSLSGKKERTEEKIEEKPVENGMAVDEEPIVIEKKAKTLKKKSAEKVTEKKSSEPIEKRNGRLGWIIFSLFLLAIILFIAWHFGNVWYSQQGNETENPPVDFTGIDCLETWPKNTDANINLTVGFSDPDGDRLTFSSNEPDHVEVFIDDRGIATVVPEKDFVGVIEIIFYAEDGRGFRVPTGNLSLCISDEELDPIARAIGFWKNNRTVIIIAGTIILLILIFIIFNKPIIRFLEEDDEIPKKKRRSPKH